MQLTAFPPLKIFLLGSFQIQGEEGSIILTARKQQSLLAFLVLHPSEQTRERLAALFWGDSSDTLARHSLRTALKNLRQQLAPDLLLADRETVQLNPAFPLWVDALAFQEKVASAPYEAIALYRGNFLADFYDEWIVPKRAQFRELYLLALDRLTQTYRTAGEYERAIVFARQLLADDLTNERAHQHLMFCQLALGNRNAALQQYLECERILQTELAVPPSQETKALYQWIEQASSERPSASARITNLPIPLSSFVGRRKEIAELKEIIPTTRLVSFTGAGGSGKTRLAIQVATDLVDLFHDGVWWVDLAPLFDEKHAPHLVAQVLGVRETATAAHEHSMVQALKDFLREKQLLLVLDNCEHLIAASAQLASALLTHCPNLRILATSREPLGITGEKIYPVPTLSLPSVADLTLTNSLIEYEGICLFVERAQSVNSQIYLNEQNARVVIEICRRLDGIPLAIELAAARTSMLSVEQIAAKLKDRFNLLTQGSRIAPPRQQTLRAAIDWSYDLMPDAARLLFRRLSVFVGGFDLQAAEQVCSDEHLTPNVILNQLSRLVDRSLVKVEPQAESMRYHMLETLREYTREKLAESDETERVRERHRDYYIRFARNAAPKLKGAEQFATFNRLERERDNLRAAWENVIERDAGLAMTFAAALFGFWYMEWNFREPRDWLSILIERTNHWGESALRAHLLGMAGWLAYYEYEISLARPLLEQSLALARKTRDQTETAFALLGLGAAADRQQEFELAYSSVAEALRIYQELQDEWGVAWALLTWPWLAPDTEERFLHSVTLFQRLGDSLRAGHVLNKLGDLMRIKGDHERAGEYYEQNLEIHRRSQSGATFGWPMLNLAWATLRTGNQPRARALFEESLWDFKPKSDKLGMLLCLAGFASIEDMNGKAESAARLFGAVEFQLWRFGLAEFVDPADAQDLAYFSAAVRAKLDPETLARVWAEGSTLTFEAALELALEQARARS